MASPRPSQRAPFGPTLALIGHARGRGLRGGDAAGHGRRSPPVRRCPRRSRPSTSGRRRCPTCSRSGSSSRSPSSPARRLCDAIAAGPNAAALSVLTGVLAAALAAALVAVKVSGRLAQHDGVNVVLAAAAAWWLGAGLVLARATRARAWPALLALERRAPAAWALAALALLVALVCFAVPPLDQRAGPRAVRPRRRRRDRRLRARADRAAAAALGPRGRPGGARRAARCSSPISSSSAPRRPPATSPSALETGIIAVPPQLPARAGQRGARRPRDARRDGVAVRRLQHLPAGGLVPGRADRLRHARAADRRDDRALVRGGLRRPAAGRHVAPRVRRGVRRRGRRAGVQPLLSGRLAAPVGAAALRDADAARARRGRGRAVPAPRARRPAWRRPRSSGSRASGRWRPSPTRRSCSRWWRASRRGSRRSRDGCARWRAAASARRSRAWSPTRCSPGRRSPPPAGCRTGASTSPTCGSSSLGEPRRPHLRRPALDAGTRRRRRLPGLGGRAGRAGAPARPARRARAPGADRDHGRHRLRERADELLRRPLAWTTS